MNGQALNIEPMFFKPGAIFPSLTTDGEAMKKNSNGRAQLNELLFQPLETEQGGVTIYETALVRAMEIALESGDAVAAELVACECVVLAETTAHSNWELIGHVAMHGAGPEAKILKAAHEAVEEDEDHRLYHARDWRCAR